MTRRKHLKLSAETVQVLESSPPMQEIATDQTAHIVGAGTGFWCSPTGLVCTGISMRQL